MITTPTRQSGPGRHARPMEETGMPKVIYNANGGDGQVPVDSNIYSATAGQTVYDGLQFGHFETVKPGEI
jgi:hypothetical protein